MNTKEKSSLQASALQITLRVTLISFFAALVAFAAVPARNQCKQKPVGAGVAEQMRTTAQLCRSPRLLQNGKLTANRNEWKFRRAANA
jgi:hypothetical protein